MTTIKIKGLLEIDPDRGVIYFHEDATGFTKLRICRLPTPIPNPSGLKGEALDITSGFGVNWGRSMPTIATELEAMQAEIKSLSPRKCTAESVARREGHTLVCRYLQGHAGFHSWMPLLTVEERSYERERNPVYLSETPRVVHDPAARAPTPMQCTYRVVDNAGALRCIWLDGHQGPHQLGRQ